MEGRRERKVVTVLFADLVGFTARAEELDPEDVDALLSRYHARLRAELERHGGTVEKFVGDAVMALFGAPVAHEDDPERAVRAALAIRDAFAEEGELELRIAVNTGEALVTLGARAAEGQGMAAGDVVNTTARLQAAAPANGILVGETTYRATSPAIEYREVEPVVAKGKTEPVPVWEAVQARSRFGVDVVQRPRAPLVGRRRELDVLRDALGRVREEREPQLVTLVGAPGLGKSRLVYELFQVVDDDPELIWWRQGRSLPYGEGVSFWALGEMVKAQAGILETDVPAAAEEKLHGALERFEDAQWLGTHLRPLVGLGGELELGGDRRTEAFAAWRRFFEALSEQRPLVLVFEDLQWADDGLLDFIDHLVDWASGVPILVIASARPELLERRPGWGGGKRNAATVSLSPLSDEDTARLIASLLERSVLAAEKQAPLLQRAGGNPLYAEEFVRMLAERGSAEEAVPETLQGIIAARLDGLSADEKTLVQDASVLGKVFWVGALAAMDGGSPQEVEDRLHALERKEFVRRERRSTVAGDSEYAFLHVLVRDVAYGQLPRAQRAEKHGAAAAWIETLGRPEDTAEMLAHHYLAALDYARAAGVDTSSLAERARLALREAGDRSFALHARTAAARFYAAALELWPGDAPERADLLFRCGRALWVGEARGVELLEEARDRFLAAGETASAAEAEALLAEAAWLRGRRDAAHAHADRAVDLLEDAPPSAAKASVLTNRARLHMLSEELEDAVRRGREALAMAESLGLKELQARLLITLGTARHAVAELEEGLAIAIEIGDPTALHRGYNNLAQEQMYAGRLEQAAEALAAGKAWNTRFGSVTGLRWVQAEEADLAYMRGGWGRAARLADEFIAELEAGSPHYQEPAMRWIRSHLALARGDVPTALAESERMLDLAREAKDPQVLLPMLGGRAWVLLGAARPDEARRLALELVEAARAHDVYPTGALTELVETTWVLAAVGLAGDLAEVLERHPSERPWVRAALAIARGEAHEAAQVLADIGARTDEAYARLRAAEAAGPGAARHLRLALAFYRSVGGTFFIRRGEALLAAAG